MSILMADTVTHFSVLQKLSFLSLTSCCHSNAVGTLYTHFYMGLYIKSHKLLQAYTIQNAKDSVIHFKCNHYKSLLYKTLDVSQLLKKVTSLPSDMIHFVKSAKLEAVQGDYNSPTPSKYEITSNSCSGFRSSVASLNTTSSLS